MRIEVRVNFNHFWKLIRNSASVLSIQVRLVKAWNPLYPGTGSLISVSEVSSCKKSQYLGQSLAAIKKI